jgi:phosphate-selective porin OprO/OprP
MTFRSLAVATTVLALLAAPPGGPAPSRAEEPSARIDDKGLTLRSPRDAVVFELGGRIHTDGGSGGSRQLSGEFPQPADIRRAWVEPTLTVREDLILALQYDASSAETPINNLLASYKGVKVPGLPFLVLTGGNFKEPFSLEQMTSNNDITFMERSLADAFAPERNTGLAIGAHGERWSLSGGVFGGNINETVDRGGLAGTARATFAPILDEGRVLHLGVAGSYRDLDRRGPDLSFSTTPESFLFRTTLVDTDDIAGGRSVRRLGLEAAWASGPLRVQGEFISAAVERERGGVLSFRGGYVYAAWVLNGKAAPYTLDADVATEMGVFERVKPASGQRVSRGGAGVWELAARVSAIDLTSQNVRGGIERNVTAGLNWYPEPFVRVMANYVRAWTDGSAVTGRDARADIGQVRVQVAF